MFPRLRFEALPPNPWSVEEEEDEEDEEDEEKEKEEKDEKDEEDEDAATVKEHVGYWNMNEFKGMEWETIEWVEEGE